MVNFHKIYDAIRESLALDCEEVIREDTTLDYLDGQVEFLDVLDIFHKVGIASTQIGEYITTMGLTDLGRGSLVGLAKANLKPVVPYFENLESKNESYVGNFTPREIQYLAKVIGP